MMTSDLNDLRRQLVDTYRDLEQAGLAPGRSGNVSMRVDPGFLITPTGIGPRALQPEQVVLLAPDGSPAAGQARPSSEWPMHAALYAARPGVNAVVHCHSRYATILACARRAIPAVHYMIAAAGAAEIPLAPYATFGSEGLARNVVQALQSGNACLLANHGQLAVAGSLGEALALAQDVEELAAVYWGCLAIGETHVLAEAEMTAVSTAFADYGQQPGTGEGRVD
jgi:L-fuculose-phosphate aldolase